MTTSQDTYNGWKNYPTWCVNLWIDNERDTHERALEIANEEINDAPNCIQVREGVWTLEQARRYNTADHLQEWVCEELAPDLGASFASDLLNYALGEVDWHEIADAWITSAQEIASMR